jgi:hypothetical protein
VTAGGKAVYEAWRAAVPDLVCNVPGGPWEDLPETVQAGFNALAAREPDVGGVLLSDYLRQRGRPGVAAMVEEAERAAREPDAADGNAPELRITDCSAHDDALHIQINTGHNWLCAVALASILAEYEPQPEEPQPEEPQPAPGIPLRSDAETCAMLRADLADYEALLARWPRCPAGCTCRIGIPEDADAGECGCDGPCNGGPQPAPGLAEAVTEARAHQALIAEILSHFSPSGSGHTARVGQVQITRWLKRAGIEQP